jgi:hypothetical protein
MRWLIVLFGLAGLAAVINACPRREFPTKTAAEKAAEAPVDYPSNDASAIDLGTEQPQAKIDGPQQDMQLKPDTPGMPAGWPPELPQYPGSTVKSVSTRTDQGELTMTILLFSDDKPQQGLDYYAQKAKAAGYTVQLEMSTQDGGGTATYDSPAWRFSVTCGLQDKRGSTISLLAVKHADAPPPPASTK